MSIGRRILRDTAIVSGLGFATQVFGFFVNVLIAKRFGATWQTDAWFIALVIPVGIAGIATGVMKVVFVPVFVEERLKRPENVARLIGSILGGMLLVSLAGMALMVVLVFTGVFDLGETPQQREIVRLLILELVPQVPLLIFGMTFYAIYQSYQRFASAELALAARPLVVVLAMLTLADRIGVHALALGNVVGQLVVLLFSIYIVRYRIGVPLSLRFGLEPALRRMIELARFPVASLVLTHTAPILRRVIAALLREGSVAVLSLSQNLSVIPMLLIGRGFTSVILSHWSKCVGSGDRETFRRNLNDSLSVLLTVILPVVAILTVLRAHLVRLAYRRGEFDEEAVALTVATFLVLLLSVIPEYVGMLVVRVFHAEKNLRVMFILGFMLVAVELPLAYVLGVIFSVGVVGIAWAMLISRSVTTLLTVLLVHFRYYRFDTRRLAWNCFVSTLACIGVVFAVNWLESAGRPLFAAVAARIPWLNVDLLFEMAVLAGAGVIVYSVLLILARHPDMDALRSIVRQRVFPRACDGGVDTVGGNSQA